MLIDELELRLTPDEYERCQQAADGWGVSIEAWARIELAAESRKLREEREGGAA